jgi:hypothetical protein
MRGIMIPPLLKANYLEAVGSAHYRRGINCDVSEQTDRSLMHWQLRSGFVSAFLSWFLRNIVGNKKPRYVARSTFPRRKS